MNDPKETKKLAQAARIAGGPALAHPPGVSPERPKYRVGETRYPPHQIKEALELAAKVGVKEAARLSGVSTWSIYKAGARPKSVRARLGPLRSSNDTRMRTFVTAAQMALYWHSNIQGAVKSAASCGSPFRKSAGREKRDCFDRAATKYGLKPAELWKAYISNQIDGVAYSS